MIKQKIVEQVLTKLRLDKNETEVYNYCVDRATAQHENIWNAFDWRDTMATLVVHNATQYTRLPSWVQSVQAISWDYKRMFQADEPITALKFTPEAWNDNSPGATPYKFIIKEPTVAIATALDGTDNPITLVSSSASDVGATVSISGLGYDGLEYSETLTLEGTSEVQSLNHYTEIYTLSKDKTVGTITAKDHNSTVVQTLTPNENYRRHYILQLIDKPVVTTKDLIILVKRNPSGFVSDYDAPPLKGEEPCLIAALEADMLEYDEQYSRANQRRSDKNDPNSAYSLFMQMVELERAQQASNFRVNPEPYIHMVRSARLQGLWMRNPYALAQLPTP